MFRRVNDCVKTRQHFRIDCEEQEHSTRAFLIKQKKNDLAGLAVAVNDFYYGNAVVRVGLSGANCVHFGQWDPTRFTFRWPTHFD